MFRARPFVWFAAGASLSAWSAWSACASDALDVESTSQSLTAGIDLIAIAQLDASQSDRSNETSGNLENGVPGNLLGGMGSGISYAGANAFLMIPDRGPNAVTYDAAIDNTASYIPRFQTVRLRLKANKPKDNKPLPFDVVTKLRKTTLLSERSSLTYGTGAGLGVGNGAPALNDKKTFYFSGRSDNFDPALPSTNARDARLDSESIRLSNDGEHVFVTDEYGPYIDQFDRQSGRRERTFTLPPEFAITHLSPVGATEISGNTAGRVANKGMEGLAITPDGKTLLGAMQSPLIQDGGTNGQYLRLVSIAIDTGAIEQFAYPLTNIGSATSPKYPTVSEITAINDHEFLVDERDGKGLGDDSKASFKQLFRIDISNAQDVSGIAGESNLAPHAIGKTLFLNLVDQLTGHGFAVGDIPAKLEGITFGPDVVVNGVGKHTLFVSNDNDFLGTITDTTHPNGIANPNQVFVFAIDPSVLPTYEPQQLTVDADDAADDSQN